MLSPPSTLETHCHVWFYILPSVYQVFGHHGTSFVGKLQPIVQKLFGHDAGTVYFISQHKVTTVTDSLMYSRSTLNSIISITIVM